MQNGSGFTLFELLVTVSILAILLGVISLYFGDTLSDVSVDQLLQESSQVSLYTAQVAALGYDTSEIATEVASEFGSSASVASLLVGTFPHLVRSAGDNGCASGGAAHTFLSTLYSGSLGTPSYTGTLTFSRLSTAVTSGSEEVSCFSTTGSSDLFITVSFPSLPLNNCASSLSGSGVYLYRVDGTSLCLYYISVL